MKKKNPFESNLIANRKATRLQRLRRKRYKYLLVLPALVCLIIFAYIPMAGIYIAFVDYKLGQGIFDAKFVGLMHFQKFFNDVSGVSMRVFRNTIVINLWQMILGMIIPCTFALFLNEINSRNFKRLIQTVTFFPVFLSPVVVYSIAYNFFSSNSGVLNKVLLNIGAIPRSINFMGDPEWAWPMIIGLNVWKGFGYSSVIYLSAITGIDQNQYEAAKIDGAGRFACMWHITLPGLLPTIVTLLILNVGGLVGGDFATMYMFTNQLNRDTMEVFSTYVYRMGLQKLRFSYATASSLVLSVIGLSLTLGSNALSRRINGRSIF